MTTTPRKAEANRQNAQHSTGPRTDPGKYASSKNATTHSLTSRGFIILPGQESNFSGLESGLRTSLLPTGVLQETLFTLILESAWNLHRCRLAESQLCSTAGVDPLLDTENAATYARIHRYSRQHQSSMYKAMRELSSVQTESQYRKQACPLTEAATAPEIFAQTPHVISELCRFEKVMSSFTRHIGAELRNSDLESKSNDRGYLARLTARERLDDLSSRETPSVVD